ncbi:MAG: hypothetical protein KDC46_10450 [Thermoleophilia bacterium]|nr:hypothetical protein [Thermoleophilia bacterium]
MAIFDRIRRAAGRTTTAPPADIGEPVPVHLLPDINQRITIGTAHESPVPSRVEDRGTAQMQLAFPAIDVAFGDEVTLTWERDDTWFRLTTRVTGVDSRSAVPTILVSASGHLSRYDERRSDLRRRIEFPVELRVLRARAIRAGRELHTYTTEVASSTITFATSAPFSPGDVVECKVLIGDGPDDVIGARLHVVRVDTHPGSWRSTCTGTIDEILRTDRARLMAAADAGGIATSELTPPDAHDPSSTASEPPTQDGVGGRDEPQHSRNVQFVLEWLQRGQSAPADDPTR